MKKITISLLALFLIFSLPVSAQDYQLDGEVTQKINYLNDNEVFEGLTELNLEFNKSFGFDKKLYINPVFKLSYDENSEFDDLGFNEKLNEDDEYDFLKEAYFDLYLNNSDIRIGKQIVDWGSAYEINPTDVVNPMDFTAADPTDAELALPSVKTDYYFDFNTSLTGVLIGQHRPSPIPNTLETMVNSTGEAMISKNVCEGIYSSLIEMNPEATVEDAKTYTSEIMENNFSINKAEEKEIEDFSDAPELALQLTRRNFKGYDLSINYFRGYSDLPLITSDYDEVMKEMKEISATYIDPTKEKSSMVSTLDFGYKETQSIGFSGRGSLGDIGAWTEINYNHNEDDEKKIDLVIGGDYTFENDFYTVAQLFHRSYKDYEINDILKENDHDKLLNDQNYLILHGEIPFRSIHTIQSDLIKDLDGEGYMLNPELQFSLGNDYSLDLGAVVMNDQDDDNGFSTINMLGKEKAYLEFTWSF